MMRRTVGFLLLLIPLMLAGKVYYLQPGDSIPAGDGPCCAIEARVRLSSARPGKLSAWTLRWGATDSLTVRFDCRNIVDGVGEPGLTIECGGVKASAPTLNFSGGWNSVAVEWLSDSTARLLAGADRLLPVAELSRLPRPTGGTVEITAASGRPSVADLIVETDDNDLSRLMTDCDPQSLPVWKYLDSTESRRAHLGGDYRLGLLPTPLGYDLIYLGGARVNGPAWRPGMCKGRLTATAYQDHYLLQWFDATGRQLPGEHYATLNLAERTLTLEFPAFPVTMRFVAQ